MNAKRPKIKGAALRGMPVKTKHGIPIVAKPYKSPSAEALRKIEAKELISALADAALEIGRRGIVGDYSKNDFHLYPVHVAELLCPDHPSHQALSVQGRASRARVAVPWPRRIGAEEPSENEFREDPFEIIGLLMRKVLDGDSMFFEAVAQTIREARAEVKSKASSAKLKSKNRVGRIVADAPYLGMSGDRDWFTRIEEPLRKSKAPYEVWRLCKQRYDDRQLPPTRRDIREHLHGKGFSCNNLRALLSRMNLDYLKEGSRNRKV